MLPHIILLTRKQKSLPLSATWSTGFSGGSSDYPIDAYGHVSVTDGTNILSGLDWGGGTVSGSNMFRLSPSTSYSWTTATTFPVATQGAVAEFKSPYFYFIGAADSVSRTAYITGSTGSSWTAISSTNKGRRQGGLAMIGSTLYAIGGIGTPDGVDNWEYYNGSSWVNGGAVPIACANTSNLAKTIGSNIYILGSGFPNNYSTFYKFDGTSFTALTNTPTTARYSSNTVLNGRFYIMGGTQSNTTHALVHSTDANGATWQVETSLPYARGFGSSITYLNQIFNFAGEGTGPNGASFYQRTIYRNNQT